MCEAHRPLHILLFSTWMSENEIRCDQTSIRTNFNEVINRFFKLVSVYFATSFSLPGISAAFEA
jgi:hypothetical protein